MSERVTVELDSETDAVDFRESATDGEEFDFAHCGHWEGHGSNEVWVPHYRVVIMGQPWRAAAPTQAEHYEAERATLAKAIHRRVSSSSIARTAPWTVGDAERAAAAVVVEGWTPPAGYGVTEEDDHA